MPAVAVWMSMSTQPAFLGDGLLHGHYLIPDNAGLDAVDIAGGAGGNVHFRMGGQIPVGLDELHGVFLKIHQLGRVAAVGVVGAQHNNDQIRFRFQAVLIGLLLHVGLAAILQHGRAVYAEIADLISVPQQLLQLGRITLGLLVVVGAVLAVGNTVADTGNADGPGSLFRFGRRRLMGRQAHKAGHEDQAAEQSRYYFFNMQTSSRFAGFFAGFGLTGILHNILLY